MKVNFYSVEKILFIENMLFFSLHDQRNPLRSRKIVCKKAGCFFYSWELIPKRTKMTQITPHLLLFVPVFLWISKISFFFEIEGKDLRKVVQKQSSQGFFLELMKKSDFLIINNFNFVLFFYFVKNNK